MKEFIIDRLIDSENFCNFESEKNALRKHIEKKSHVVVYGPRNFGKTSLLKNILLKEFKKKHKKSFIFFADLMEVHSMDALISRLKTAFEHSFEESFPIKTILQSAKDIFASIRPEIGMDPLTAQPSLSITLSKEKKEHSIPFIFQLIKEVSKKVPSIVVIDEFQDIAQVPEAQALFRRAFQEIEFLPIVLMGSKRHILSDIFSNPQAPLAFWGQDVAMSYIPYAEYHTYILERFATRKISISLEDCTYLQNLVHRVPESVNILCQQLMKDHKKTTVTSSDITLALKNVLAMKESRYENYLGNFSGTEQTVLGSLAAVETISKPQGQEFVSATGLTSRSVGKIIQKLYDRGIIEKDQGNYRISDPLLRYYLVYYRHL